MGKDEKKLADYVRRWHKRNNGKVCEPWPTVRLAAKSMRWSMKRVEETVEGCGEGLMLESYFTAPPEPLADHFVTFYES